MLYISCSIIVVKSFRVNIFLRVQVHVGKPVKIAAKWLCGLPC